MTTNPSPQRDARQASPTDPLLASLLPAGVETCERRDDPPILRSFHEEVVYVADAVDSRRREFFTVRACARDALARFGVDPLPLVPGVDRAPRWPHGFVGSMTHCAGFRGAAIARATQLSAVGIDAEPDIPLPEDLHYLVVSGVEIDQLSKLPATGEGLPACWYRLAFSCKESAFKAWYPLTHRWLEFDDVHVRLDPAEATFSAQILPAGALIPERQKAFHGHWIAQNGLIVSATGTTADAV